MKKDEPKQLKDKPVSEISLREHFAGLAMEMILKGHGRIIGYKEIAECAVRQADALIKALEEREGE